MEQISGALVGIGLVLTAVLLPMAFFGGSTGVIYRQFSVTVVTAAVMSVMRLALITVAGALRFTAEAAERRPPRRHGPLARFNRWFNGSLTGRVCQRRRRRHPSPRSPS